MPPPRRSTRSAMPQPERPARGRREHDPNAALPVDDFRRTGSSGLVLMILAGMLVGGGLGLLALPQILKKSSKPAAVQEPEPEAKKNAEDSKTEPEGLDPEKLYPHANRPAPRPQAPKDAPVQP
ncbi:MAG: hypothetical protein M5U26_24990 [Planctomycetota bacterium]|nr:hypothetical protein [Planctomycetota bacterium]